MLAITLLLLGSALAQAEESPPPCEVYFQAHRGGVNEMPENTLVAFKKAFSIPGAVPEVDLRTTQDGVIVCLHDETLARTTNAPAPWRDTNVAEIPYEIVKSWDAGSHFDGQYAGERVPTLEALFALLKEYPERRLYLDLKGVNLDQLVAMIHKEDFEKRVIFVHGDPEMCKKLQQLYPGAKTMTWLSGLPSQMRKKYEALKANNFDGISQLQFHLRPRRHKPGEAIRYVFKDADLAQFVQETKAAGVELQLRPFIFDEESLSRLIALGAHWYVSDDPVAFAASLAQACARLQQTGDENAE